MKYRKKPVVIEAYQTNCELIIHTLEGDMKASVGDYIITGVNGEQYPCKPDIFEKTYEKVEVTESEIADFGLIVTNAIINNLTAEDSARYFYINGYRLVSKVRAETAKEFAKKATAKMIKECYNYPVYGILSKATDCVKEVATEFGAKGKE